MIRTSAVLAILVTMLALTPPLAAQTRIGREQTIHKSAASGQTVRVFTYAVFRHDCTAGAPPEIVILTQPAHGTVSVQPGPSTVNVIRNDAADCSGRTYPGTAVFYTPQPGFRGTDQFDYNVVSRNSSAHDTAIVDVR